MNCAPTRTTHAMATMPSISMPGKNHELRSCARRFDSRFAMLSRSNSRLNADSRLNAWMIATPETDSAICAVIVAIVSRTRRNAACDRTWNHRVRTSVGGGVESATEEDERDEPQPPVEDEQSHDRCEQHQRVRDERREALREHVRERV